MLRVSNATHDVAYVQWDPRFLFDNVSFHALFDVRADPWQRENVWGRAPAATQDAYAAELAALFLCGGTRATPSNCPGVLIDPVAGRRRAGTSSSDMLRDNKSAKIQD